MIASYLHNFIFIKTRKTAGTTVEVALATCCGPDDIVTPLGPHDELARSNGAPVCRNFASDPAVEETLHQAVLQKDRKAYAHARRNSIFYSHMPARAIRKKLAPEFWDRAQKITIERHPYEKAVSAAYFNYKEGDDGPFPDYLQTFIEGGSYATFSFYAINGKSIIDEFLRQETLEPDLKRLAEKLHLELPPLLPRMKSSSRLDKRPAREILTDAQKETVYSFCRPEFELLGYER
jgi:hypothetical protein